MSNENGMPKKNVLSAQIDLSKFDFATEEEKKQQDVMSESTTFFKDSMKRLRKNPLAMGSIIVLILILLVIIFAPKIVPYGYSEIITVDGVRDKTAKNLAPFTYSKMEQKYIEKGGTVFPHIFGTDEQCRDYFIRVVYGTRVSLSVGLFASIIVLIIGVVYGSISGYAGGKVDLIMMRIVDIIYSLPDLLMVILLSVVLGETLGTAIKGTVFVYRIRTVILGKYGASGAWTDPYDQAERLCTGFESDRYSGIPDHPYAHPAELSFCYHYFRSIADPFRNLYRELFKFLRSWCTGSDAVAWFPGERGERRTDQLSVQTDFPGCYHRPYRVGI